MAPERVIEGQATKLTRANHGIAYDAIHDEIVTVSSLASAILVFRGGASGNESPIRVIQGPKTGLTQLNSLGLDVAHGEIMVTEYGGTVLTFARDANGDVAPLRVLHGPKTKITMPYGVAADSTRDLLLIANSKRGGEGEAGILIFDRTDDGNVSPAAIIGGPNTGLLRPSQLEVYAKTGKVVVAVRNADWYSPYYLDRLEMNTGMKRFERLPSPWEGGKLGFIGVWNVTDSGDVAPHAIVRGPLSGLIQPSAVALNPKTGEIFVGDTPHNSISTVLMPEVFRK
jgi:hypothetical protein